MVRQQFTIIRTCHGSSRGTSPRMMRLLNEIAVDTPYGIKLDVTIALV
jgi:hypothetical protein